VIKASLGDNGVFTIEGFRVPEHFAPSRVQVMCEYGVFMGEIGGSPTTIAPHGSTCDTFQFRTSASGTSYEYERTERSDSTAFRSDFSEREHKLSLFYRNGEEEDVSFSFAWHIVDYPTFLQLKQEGAKYGNDLDDIDLDDKVSSLFVRSHEHGDCAVYREITVPRVFRPVYGSKIKRAIEL
jgi:hypothetical protein